MQTCILAKYKIDKSSYNLLYASHKSTKITTEAKVSHEEIPQEEIKASLWIYRVIWFEVPGFWKTNHT